MTKKRDKKEFAVVSDGEGIDPKFCVELFEKFATKSISGTGLGLYITKNTVEAHARRIWDTNNKDVKGANLD